MPFTLSDHAKFRMDEIGVSDDLVLAAVRKPSRSRLNKLRRSVVCSLDLSLGFTLAAVVDIDTGVIMTVYPQGCDRPAAKLLTASFKKEVACV